MASAEREGDLRVSMILAEQHSTGVCRHNWKTWVDTTGLFRAAINKLGQSLYNNITA